MSSTVLIPIAIIIGLAIITRGVVDIIRVAKAPGSKTSAQFKALEDDVADLEQELQEMRKRVEVLETIVTDGKYDLGKKIDDLAAGS